MKNIMNVPNEDRKAIAYVKQSAKYNSHRYRFDEFVMSHFWSGPKYRMNTLFFGLQSVLPGHANKKLSDS